MEGLLGLALVTAVLIGFFTLLAYSSRIVRALEQAHIRWRVRRAGPVPAGRPIEVVAADARRLRRECSLVPRDTPVARRRGIVLAYDDILAEAAHSLSVQHELHSLPLGPARDMQRIRLEADLESSGFRLTA
ncbi:MAG: hypothetical protein M3313_13965 [Actinomycetota bacterium]|nr:hypothetical protein [Actinomycetota bacterium]